MQQQGLTRQGEGRKARRSGERPASDEEAVHGALTRLRVCREMKLDKRVPLGLARERIVAQFD